MDPVSLQASVAEKIKALYAISRELEQLFPGRHYTPDGHMIGSIGEALAASWYGLELFTAGAETHDAKAPMAVSYKSRPPKLTGWPCPANRNGYLC